MATLTEKLNGLNKRIGALESGRLDDNAAVANIQKIYSNIKLNFKVTVKEHKYHICGNNVFCSSDTKI